MANYQLGSGGFKLGERVEVLTTKQRGVLVAETVHISGCNTYQIILPGVVKDGRMRVTYRDHLMLRKLEDSESLLDPHKELTDENSLSPKGIDVNAQWIQAAIDAGKENVPEIDDAVGVEEITVPPGMEVWNKTYGMKMIVYYITRDIFSKELIYGLMYMADDREQIVFGRGYELVPLESKIEIYTDGKTGAVFEDARSMLMRSRSESRVFIA